MSAHQDIKTSRHQDIREPGGHNNILELVRRESNAGFPDFDRLRVEFVATKIDLGHTYATIALLSKDDSIRSRNRATARRAYDAAIRHAAKLAPTSDEARAIKMGLARLKSELRKLGEADLD